MQVSPQSYKNALKNAKVIAPEILQDASNINASRVEDRGGRYLEVIVSYLASPVLKKSFVDDVNSLTEPRKFNSKNRRRVVVFLMDKETGELKGIDENPVSA